jgi:hypothetical protein
VDTAHGVISHVQANFADSRDSLHLPQLLTGLQRRLRAQGLRLHELLADAGYANGSNYALLEAQHIGAWIPVFGKYKPGLDGFTYAPLTDTFTCAEGKTLPFQKYDTNQDGSWHKTIGPPAATANSARADRPAPHGPGASRVTARFTTQPTAAPGCGSKAAEASVCCGSGKARWSPCSGA